MKVKKQVKFAGLDVVGKAGFIGYKPEGLIIVSEVSKPSGSVEFEFTYQSWVDSNLSPATILIIPILDTDYCQIIKVGE